MLRAASRHPGPNLTRPRSVCENRGPCHGPSSGPGLGWLGGMRVCVALSTAQKSCTTRPSKYCVLAYFFAGARGNPAIMFHSVTPRAQRRERVVSQTLQARLCAVSPPLARGALHSRVRCLCTALNVMNEHLYRSYSTTTTYCRTNINIDKISREESCTQLQLAPPSMLSCSRCACHWLMALSCSEASISSRGSSALSSLSAGVPARCSSSLVRD